METARGDELVARQERLPWNAFYFRAYPLVGFGTFFDAFDAQALSGVIAIVTGVFSLTLLQSSAIISVTYAGNFVGAWLFGWLAEKYSRKTSFEVCLLSFGLLSLVCAIAPDYNALLYARFLQGFGLGGEVPIAGSIITEFVRKEHRGLLVQAYEYCFGIGLTTAPLLLALLISAFGDALAWRLILAVGGLTAPWVILVYLFLPESPRQLVDHGKLDQAEKIIAGVEQRYAKKGVVLSQPVMRPTVHADVKKTKILELFSKDYRTRTIMCAFLWFGAYYPQYGFTLFIPTIFVQLGHVTLTQALLLTSIPSVVLGYGLPQSVLGGYIQDKMGRRFMVVSSFAALTVVFLIGYVVFNVMHLSGWWWVYLFGGSTAGSFAAYSVNTGIGYNYNPELYPTRMRSLATAAGTSWARVAAAVAAPINALLLGGAATAAKMTTTGLGDVYLVIAIVELICFVVTFALAPETAGRQLEEASH